jgi:quinolinate synthase
MNEVDQVGRKIEAIRKEYGSRLMILGHLYQRSSVIGHADVTGDSLELSRKAAQQRDAERIVFCGVRFMAESADILTSAEQSVYMPDTSAGCPMANMAGAEDVEAAWSFLQRQDKDRWVPVVYVNSTAEIKALCGRWGGSTCTSSNAAAVFRWALDQDKRIFFLPDEHLGWNTAHDLGLADDRVAVYDPRLAGGGLSSDAIRRAAIVVWKGFCLVHAAFSAEHVRLVRARHPDARIIVHPETPKEVLRMADAHGSTSQICRYVEGAPAGCTVVVGTEQNLVERLAETHRGRVSVLALSPSVCANMARTNESNLLAVLRDWPERNRIVVPPAIAADARTALARMLAI